MAKDKEAATLAHADPLCVRFHEGDLHRIDRVAEMDGLARSVWIREVALARAALVLGNHRSDVVPLALDKTKRGTGSQICIRFRPADWLLVVRAADKEGTIPSPWIRALVMQRVGRGEGEHGDGGDKSTSGGNDSGSDGEAQRLSQQDGFASPLPVVGKSRRASPSRGARHPQGT